MIEFQSKEQRFKFEPFQASKNYIDHVSNMLIKLARDNEQELATVKRYVKELEEGRYYNAIDIVRKFGIPYSHASVFWKAAIVLGAIKRVEFAKLAPVLIHESELPAFFDFIVKFKTLGKGWNAVDKLLRQALSNEMAKTEEGATVLHPKQLTEVT